MYTHIQYIYICIYIYIYIIIYIYTGYGRLIYLLLSLPLVPDADQVQIFGGAVRLCTLSEFWWTPWVFDDWIMCCWWVFGDQYIPRNRICESVDISGSEPFWSVDPSRFSYLSHFAEVSLGVYIDGNWQFDSFHREIGCSLKDRGGVDVQTCNMGGTCYPLVVLHSYGKWYNYRWFTYQNACEIP